MVHDQLADLIGGSFAFRGIDQECLSLIHDRFQLGCRDRAFLASAQQAAQHLLAFEFFPAAVFLDHHVGDFIDAFVGSKALVATLAFATTANRICFFAFARIHDTILRESAIRAFHQ
jgi:hypothetical protein